MNVWRRLASLLAAVVMSSSLLATPAIAAAIGGGVLCTPEEAAAARLPQADRDGFLREPDLGQAHVDLPASAQGKAPSDFSVTIPVWFHVITSDGVGNLTSRQIAEQVRVLNVTFGGREGGDDTGFKFALAGVTRTDNAKWFAAKPGAEHDFKQTLKQGGDETLNVYTTSGAGLLGWAYLPSITDSNQTYLDGVVIHWASVPGASDLFEDRYDLGETLTHEVGHWLNLEHTFFNGCTKSGDFVDDTPAMKVPTSGCPVGKDTCPAPGLDPIHNYMDYSYDSCYTEFTPGQTQRMRDAWLFYRAS